MALTDTASCLQAMGYAPDTRLVILHADDVGMCQAETQSFLETAAAGLVRCGAIMAPCPWVPAIAHAFQKDPTLDLGAHMTLNAEWVDYRWGPLSTRDPESGLMDAEGAMWSTVDAFNEHAQPAAAIAELHAQVDHLLAQGIDLTHIDSHMGTVFHPEIAAAYMEMGLEYRLPIMVPRGILERMAAAGVPADALAKIKKRYDALLDHNYPLIDCTTTCGGGPERRMERYLKIIDELPAGVTHLLFHAARPSAELQGLAWDWPNRVADHNVFTDPAVREYIEAKPNYVVIGYRDLRDFVRAQ